MKVNHTLLVVISALILGFAGISYATTTKPAKAPAKATVKQADLTQNNSNWHDAVGRVVKADIANNTLVLNSHGKDMRFHVPGRIDMLNLKHNEPVSVVYVAEGGQLHLWELKTK